MTIAAQKTGGSIPSGGSMGFTVCKNWKKDDESCEICATSLGNMECWEAKTLETQEEVDRFYRGYRY